MLKNILTHKSSKATTELQVDRALMTRPGAMVFGTDADTSNDGGGGIDVLRAEASGQLNLVAGSVLRKIEIINLGKGDGRSTAVISSSGLMANGSRTIVIERDREDQVTLQSGNLNGHVLVGRQAFKQTISSPSTVKPSRFALRTVCPSPCSVAAVDGACGG